MTTRYVIYGIVVAGYVTAGGLDLLSGEWRRGSLALIFAVANALMFLWR